MKHLPTFGTHQERKERLKKFYGINSNHGKTDEVPAEEQPQLNTDQNKGVQNQNFNKKSNVVNKIEEFH